MSIKIATIDQLQELLKPIENELQELKEKFTPKEPEQWLTREETANLLQIAYPTLHDWCNKKILKSYKIGNRTYFNRKEINEILFNSNK